MPDIALIGEALLDPDHQVRCTTDLEPDEVFAQLKAEYRYRVSQSTWSKKSCCVKSLFWTMPISLLGHAMAMGVSGRFFISRLMQGSCQAGAS